MDQHTCTLEVGNKTISLGSMNKLSSGLRLLNIMVNKGHTSRISSTVVSAMLQEFLNDNAHHLNVAIRPIRSKINELIELSCDRQQFHMAVCLLDILLSIDPHNKTARLLKGDLCTRSGIEYDPNQRENHQPNNPARTRLINRFAVQHKTIKLLQRLVDNGKISLLQTGQPELLH